jgi:DNA-binding beta-propeller fold protein YncE
LPTRVQGSCTTNGTSHAYNAGDTCTVDVTFTPKYPGQRLGAVELTTTDGATIATAHVYGIGTGPQIGFLPGVTATVGSGFNTPYGVAVGGSGNVFVADTNNNAVKEIVAVGGVTSSTSTVLTLGSGFSFPYGVAVDSSGNVFVADYGDNAVVKEILAVGGVPHPVPPSSR